MSDRRNSKSGTQLEIHGRGAAVPSLELTAGTAPDDISIESMDALPQFVAWFQQQNFYDLCTTIGFPRRGLRNFGKLVAWAIYRREPFQVELVIIPPGSGGFSDPHRHPNVDSYEIFLAGELFFAVGPDRNRVIEQLRQARPLPAPRGMAVRVFPSDWHGAVVGPGGAVFFSCQHWLNGVAPTAVGLDWEGPPLSSQHLELLRDECGASELGERR